MKRINVFMEEELHSKVKVLSALKGRTINAYIIEALSNKLKKDKTIFEQLK